MRHTLSCVPDWQDRAAAQKYMSELYTKAYGVIEDKNDQELDVAALAAIPRFG